MEKSYMDLLCELQKSVESDCIPQADKQAAYDLIARLKSLLWAYSH